MHRIDGAGATADNKFTEGDAATGVAATVVTDDWLNAVQEEIATVVEQTGGMLDKAQTNQLWTRLSAWFAKAQTATETLLGQLRVGTQAEVNAGELDDVAVTPKKLRWGFSILTGENGGIIFPSWLGGLMILWMRNTGLTIDNTLRSTTFTFPVALTTEMYWCSPFYGGGITGGDSISTARGNSTLTSVAINYTKTGVQYTNIGFLFIVIGR